MANRLWMMIFAQREYGGMTHETLFKSARIYPVHVAADGIS